MLSVAICFFATIILWHYQSLLPLDKNCCNNLLLLFLLPRLATVLKWWQYVSIATILALLPRFFSWQQIIFLVVNTHLLNLLPLSLFYFVHTSNCTGTTACFSPHIKKIPHRGFRFLLHRQYLLLTFRFFLHCQYLLLTFFERNIMRLWFFIR